MSLAWKPRSRRVGSDVVSGGANPCGPGQFEQRQRVSARLGDDPLAYLLVQRHMAARGKQLPCVGVAQTIDEQAGQLVELSHVAGQPDGEHHGHRFGGDAPGEEGQCLQGGRVQPLRVVDHAQQRALTGLGGQQLQGRQTDTEHVGGARTRSESGLEAVAVRGGQCVEMPQHRHAQLVQGGERQFRLVLRPGRPHSPEP